MIALYQPPALMTHYFLQAILVGFCLGLFYEILMGVGIVCGLHRWAVYVMDGIFWLAVLIVYFVFTVTLAGGQVRGFMIAGMGGGILFFHLTLGWLVCKIICGMIRVLVLIGRKIFQIMQAFFHFVQLVWKWMQKNFEKIFKKTSIFGKKTL